MEKVFAGEVIERPVSAPKPIIASSSGFPRSAKSSTTSKYIATKEDNGNVFMTSLAYKVNNKPAALTKDNQSSQSSQFVDSTIHRAHMNENHSLLSTTSNSTHNPTSDERSEDYEKDNINAILSMSKQQRENALGEITSTLSSKSIQFLLNKISDKKRSEVANLIQNNLRQPEFDKSRVTVNMAELTTHEEIDLALSNAPQVAQASTEWIRGNITVCNSNQTPHNSNNNLTSSFRLNKDRFDLKGCKVINPDILSSQILEIFLLTYPFSHIPSEQLQTLISSFVRQLLHIGFFTAPSPEDSQPQHELHNHQYDQDQPGYTFTEISEMLRSEVPNQHDLALCMITGILAKRDMAVSVEAYGSLSISAGGYSLNVADPEWLHLCKVYNSFVEKIKLALMGFPEAHKTTEVMAKRVARIVAFSIQTAGASDLPVALPTLLVWSLGRKSALKSKMALYLSFNSFIQSKYETIAATQMWNSFWGVYGQPVLTTPHARRVEVTYADHLQNCDDNLNKSSDAKSESPMQNFALECRWARADGLIFVDTLLESVSKAIISGEEILLAYLSDIDSYSKGETDKSTLGFESSIMLGCALSSFQILVSLAESTRNAESHDKLFVQLQRIWTNGSKLISITISFQAPNTQITRNEQVRGYLRNLQESYWRLLATLARRGARYANWIGSSLKSSSISLSSLATQYIQLSLIGEGEATCCHVLSWLFRLWRTLITYGYPDSIAQVSTFSQTLIWKSQPQSNFQESNISIKIATIFGPSIAQFIANDNLLIDVISLLDQTCAAVSRILCQFRTAWDMRKRSTVMKNEELLESMLIWYQESTSSDLSFLSTCIDIGRNFIPITLKLLELLPELTDIDESKPSQLIVVTLNFIATSTDSTSYDINLPCEDVTLVTSSKPFSGGISLQPQTFPSRIPVCGIGLLLVCNELSSIFESLAQLQGEYSCLQTKYMVWDTLVTHSTSIHQLSLISKQLLVRISSFQSTTLLSLIDHGNWLENEIQTAKYRIILSSLSAKLHVWKLHPTSFAIVNSNNMITQFRNELCVHKVLVSGVNEGLFSWQSVRLREARILLLLNMLSTLHEHQASNDLSKTNDYNCQVMENYLQAVSSLRTCTGPAKHLLLFVLSTCVKSANVHTNVQSELIMKVFVLLGMKCSQHSTSHTPDTSWGFLYNFAYATNMNSQCYVNSISNAMSSNTSAVSLTSWVNQPTPKRNLDWYGSEWIFRMLLQLEHPYFSAWLSVLCSSSMFLANFCLEHNLNLVLYVLLSVTTPENTHRWFDQTDSTIKDFQPRVETSLSYIILFLNTTKRFLNASNSNASMEAFIDIVYQESPATTLRRFASRQSKYAVNQSNRSEIALLELTDKLLESCFGQYLGSVFHSMVINLLLHPSMPWRVHARIWGEFGRLRLMHLLELQLDPDAQAADIQDLSSELENFLSLREAVKDFENTIYDEQYYGLRRVVSNKSLCINVLSALLSIRRVEDSSIKACSRGTQVLYKFVFDYQNRICSHGNSNLAVNSLVKIALDSLELGVDYSNQEKSWVYKAVEECFENSIGS